jgi:hypothetical protein
MASDPVGNLHQHDPDTDTTRRALERQRNRQRAELAVIERQAAEGVPMEPVMVARAVELRAVLLVGVAITARVTDFAPDEPEVGDAYEESAA